MEEEVQGIKIARGRSVWSYVEEVTKELKENPTTEVNGLGSEILKSSKTAVITKIETSTLDGKDDSGYKKPKICIKLQRHPEFQTSSE